MSSGDPKTRELILSTTWRLMEKSQGKGVRIEDVAQAAGISRQAVYLHFPSRTDLLIATARYADQVHGIEERLQEFRHATGAVKTMNAYLNFWANYIPEIYGLAKALQAARETDEAAKAAWEDRMGAMAEGCRCVIECLEREHLLAEGWTKTEAIDMLWSLLSVSTWENLTIDRGWKQSQYLAHMRKTLKRLFVRKDSLNTLSTSSV